MDPVISFFSLQKEKKEGPHLDHRKRRKGCRSRAPNMQRRGGGRKKKKADEVLKLLFPSSIA